MFLLISVLYFLEGPERKLIVASRKVLGPSSFPIYVKHKVGTTPQCRGTFITIFLSFSRESYPSSKI